ncbi:hypothetical protein N806_24105 [Rhodococcus sp. P27]|nr:hypothetical protein N806_24105 [Rhodococcus sp. P27]
MAQLNPRDAEFIYHEGAGHLNHLIAVYFFETSLHPSAEFTAEQAVDWVTARLGCDRMFTQRVQRTPLGLDHPYWVTDPDFDVRKHVYVNKIDDTGWAALQKPLSALLTTKMDLRRPPWELHFFVGLEGLEELPGRLTAVVLKSHHSAADGIAIRTLGETIFSGKVQQAGSEPPVPFVRARIFTKSLLGFPGRIYRFARQVPGNRRAQRDADAAKRAGEWVESLNERPAVRFNGKVSGVASLEPMTMSGEQVRAIKDSVPGATVNDVLLAVVGGALTRYLTEKDERPRDSLIAMVPRSVRKVEAWESANQLVALLVDMHTQVKSPLERLALISSSARSEKARTSHPAVRRAGAAVETTPRR